MQRVARNALGISALGLAISATNVARAEVYAWWPLDDGSGDTARDLGPRQEDAIIFDHDFGGLGPNGSVWVNDPQRGTVLGLAGDTAWVSAGFLPIMDLDNQFSWSFWARQDPAQASPANDIVIGNRFDESGVDTVPREFIKFTPDRFEYHMNAGAVSNDLQYATNDIPSNDQWIHHAVVKEGDAVTYFRNGVVGNEGFVTSDMLSPDPLPFAMGGQNGVETWRGSLSDVQLYEGALTAAELQQVIGGNVAAGKNLYARWKLDDGAAAGDTAADSGPRGEDAVIFDWNVDGLVGPNVWYNDPERGTVLGLGGNTAWVDAGEIPVMDLDNNFTWTFWAKQDPGQASPSNDIVIGNRYGFDGADTFPREFIKFTPDRFEYHMDGAPAGDTQYAAGNSDIPSNDEWLHHLVVKDGDVLKYYRDGILTNQRTITDEMLSDNPLPFAMGGQNGAETWAGYLSDVRLFDHALTNAEIAQIVGGSLQGDYNGNGQLDAGDLDLQSEAMASGTNPAAFDLNSDGTVDLNDRIAWVNDLKGTWMGDADLNGEFNSSDFVAVFQAGKFEQNTVAATWSEGDWDGNQRFNSGDFVVAFQQGGYEMGPRPAGAVSAVPEPNSILLLCGGLLGLLYRIRRR
jgi:hypothetical protein